jgi:hypothetical protein
MIRALVGAVPLLRGAFAGVASSFRDQPEPFPLLQQLVFECPAVMQRKLAIACRRSRASIRFLVPSSNSLLTAEKQSESAITNGRSILEKLKPLDCLD